VTKPRFIAAAGGVRQLNVVYLLALMRADSLRGSWNLLVMVTIGYDTIR